MQIQQKMNKNNYFVSRETIKQFIFFAAIGGVGTAGQYLTLIALVELKILTSMPASVIGVIIGALINYALNYRYTFNSKKSHKEAMSKFFTVALFGAITNTSLMYVGVIILKLYYLASQLIATCIVLLWNFAANKLWTFRD